MCTKILIAVNIVYFLILSFGGMTEDGMYLLEHGAVYVPYVVEYKEYYRLFTSMFLHFDITHLMNNMVTLGVVGLNVEPILGKARLLIVYLYTLYTIIFHFSIDLLFFLKVTQKILI